MDPVQAIIEYLVGYGVPGLIAAYFANRYLQKEREMEQLRERYEARLQEWFTRYQEAQRLRLEDWQKWSDQRTMMFTSSPPGSKEAAAQLYYPRSYEMQVPSPTPESAGDD
jgi:hypothetical protein